MLFVASMERCTDDHRYHFLSCFLMRRMTQKAPAESQSEQASGREDDSEKIISYDKRSYAQWQEHNRAQQQNYRSDRTAHAPSPLLCKFHCSNPFLVMF